MDVLNKSQKVAKGLDSLLGCLQNQLDTHYLQYYFNELLMDVLNKSQKVAKGLDSLLFSTSKKHLQNLNHINILLLHSNQYYLQNPPLY